MAIFYHIVADIASIIFYVIYREGTEALPYNIGLIIICVADTFNSELRIPNSELYIAIVVMYKSIS